MAQAGNQELTDRFDRFFRDYYDERIGRLAQRYPNEQRSLYVDYNDLYTFDPDLAEDYVTKPDQLQDYAEEALRLYDLPADVKLGQAHVRLRGLSSDRTVPIRDIRVQDDHIGSLIAVQGIVRKATDVRPKVTEAAFECQRCGTMTYIPQGDGSFQEPHECQGCERQGPFRVNHDQSEFVDSQKIRVQESPEGLRGGETPQSIDVNLVDDVTGEVTAGDHVTVTGVLHIDQVTQGNEKTSVFDLYMDGVAVEIEDEEFEDMDITESDVQRIVELSQAEDLYEQMVGSIAPAIYGYDEEKLAMVLQLFSGVTKHLPDNSRIRGDLHMLLIGDPGTGKCVHGDTRITLGDGRRVPIRDFVESNLDEPTPVDDGVWDRVDVDVPSLTSDGKIGTAAATKVWKREAPPELVRIRTSGGAGLTVTPSHPLFTSANGVPVAETAAELSEGDFVAVPGEFAVEGRDSLYIDYRKSRSHNAVRLDPPSELQPWFARFVGYVVAEGYVEIRDDETSYVSVTNNDSAVLDDVSGALDRLGVNWFEREPHEGKDAREIICSSSELASYLRGLSEAIPKGSDEQRVPQSILGASERARVAFLRAYVESEGHVSAKEREITIASMSEDLLRDVRSLLRSLGIGSQLHPRRNESHRLRISGDDFASYVGKVGFVIERKSVAAGEFDDVDGNTNTDVVPIDGDELRRVRERLRLSQDDCGLPRTTYQHYECGDRNPSRERFETVLDRFEHRLGELRELRDRVQNDWDAILEARHALGLSQADIAKPLGVEQTAVSYYERNDVMPDGGATPAVGQFLVDEIEDALSASDAIDRFRFGADSDVAWERIESIERVDHEEDWVYDLEVEGTHSYVSNGVVSHNSQLLSYIEQVAPRSVYTSGKGSSAAGLTAAAVRDDFGEGQQWTLEAGALVLADKGIAAVDELDKMEAGDRSAMHEGLEQQKISISKAGINATLKARCSLLGAANPKYGRFDQYEPIGEQIDLEPALVSRFDLIFTVTDQPDPEEDSRLAEHILTTNYAGELNTQHEELASSEFTREEIERVTEEVAPAIDAELLRKYIAYAKRNVYPTMSEAARDAIEEFYVDLRAKGADEDAPVPVTARKLEALIRLAEASARVRLSDTVDEQDAERAIEITRSCLEDIGVDPETGEFDADVVETGTTKTQRDRIQNIRGLIEEIEAEYEDGAPQEEVLERADEIGMDPEKAEEEIEKLRRKGEVYEPTQGHLRTT